MAGAHGSLIMLLLMLILSINNGSSIDECRESCGQNEPIIRFPFQLVKESSQDQCLYPEFCLYCIGTGYPETMLSLPTTSGPIKFLVDEIDYESNRITVWDLENCMAKKIMKLTSSSFLPYRFSPVSETTEYSFFNCSSISKQHLGESYDQSLNMINCPIYASYSNDNVFGWEWDGWNFALCIKMFDINLPIMTPDLLDLSWPKQNCTECEAKGMKCKWKNNGTKGETECFHCKDKRKTIQIPKPFTYSATG